MAANPQSDAARRERDEDIVAQTIAAGIAEWKPFIVAGEYAVDQAQVAALARSVVAALRTGERHD